MSAMIRPLPLLLATSLVLLTATVQAQSYWKWRDANGTLQISDQPPPMTVPDKDVLARPGQRAVSITPAAPAPVASAASGASRRDPELEARQRKLQAAEAASQAQASKDREQAQREGACRAARNQLAVLDSGRRVARPNAKGEMEYVDDATREQDSRRAREQIAKNCD